MWKEKQFLLNERELLNAIDKQISFYRNSKSVNDYEKGCNSGAVAALEYIKDTISMYCIK